MLPERAEIGKIVETLRQQRDRREDLKRVLQTLIGLADEICHLGPAAPYVTTAREMRLQADRLLRAKGFVPAFVVRDLLDDTICRIERALHQ